MLTGFAFGFAIHGFNSRALEVAAARATIGAVVGDAVGAAILGVIDAAIDAAMGAMVGSVGAGASATGARMRRGCRGSSSWEGWEIACGIVPGFLGIAAGYLGCRHWENGGREGRGVKVGQLVGRLNAGG